MRRGNRGYSLIELIITMAIFSIVMVSIILMMRTSLISYRNGLFESSLQEEAQIVANQVADVLVDCSAYVSTSTDTDTGVTTYKFKGPDDKTVELSSSEGNLYYNSTHLLSDQLAPDGFLIKGLDTREDEDAVYDNIATVEITLNKNGREYIASKDVYFRNHIEYQDTTVNPDPFDVSGAPDNTTGLSGNEKVATILRYRLYDLSEKYGIVSNVKLSDSANNLFGFYGEDGKIVTNVSSCSANKYITGDAYKHVIIGVKVPGPSNFSANTTANPEAYYVEGKDIDGHDVKVYLELKKVEINSGAGVYVMRGEGTYPGGFPTHPVVTGIDINEAIHNDLKVEYDVTFSTDGTPNGVKMNKQSLKYISNDYVTQNDVSNNLGIDDKTPFGLCPEPIEGGLVMTGKGIQYNTLKTQPVNYGDYAFLQDETKTHTALINIYFDGKATPYSTFTYYMKATGQSLENIN